MPPTLVNQQVLHSHAFKIGYTAEKVFYDTANLMLMKVEFNHDEKTVVFQASGSFRIVLKYKNIAFMNIQKDDLLIAYKRTPVYELIGGVHNIAPLDKSVKDDLHTGSAIHLEIGCESTLRLLKEMMVLNDVRITEEIFNFRENNIDLPANFVTENYLRTCIHSLGFPGSFLLRHCEKDTRLDEKRLLDIYHHVAQDRHLTSLNVPVYLEIDVHDDDYAKVRSVTVTPTGIFYKPPKWILSNFALRKVDVDKVISVTFSDNDGQPIRDQRFIKESAVNFCRNGLDVCGDRYNHFLGSSSKFREHSHYFYQGSKDEILNLWKSMGNYNPDVVAKVGARVGLNATSTEEGVELENYIVSPDITSHDGRINYSEGCGKISEAFAIQMQEAFGLKYLPSAFQIRFPGFKGVLLLNKKYPLPPGVDVEFTAAMQKFRGETDGASLDLIKCSRPVSLKMNKIFIEVLSQKALLLQRQSRKQTLRVYKDQVESRITELAKNSVIEVIDKCVNPAKFLDTLESLPKYMDYRQMKSFSQYELLSEPFLRSLVQADAAVSMRKLQEKQQIRIDPSQGRLMFGVADFHRLLKPNQVYVRYTNTLDPECPQKTVLKGPVGVTRSPLYHLDGIQFVEAVDVPYYTGSGICDVIVFPTTGSIPLQQLMAHGDFDGDEYAVFWDPDLMLPPTKAVLPPKDDTKLPIINVNELQHKYPEFVGEFMTKQPVGVYASNHFHLAEFEGYDHPDIRELATKNENSLIYFKSGVAPADLLQKEKMIFSPEHMGRSSVPSYRINNVLGKNYLLFREFFEDIEDVQKTDKTKVKLDREIYVDGWQAMIEEAKTFHRRFLRRIRTILEPYGTWSMAEIFAGKTSVTKRDGRQEDNSPASAKQIIQKQLKLMMREFRANILNKCGCDQKVLNSKAAFEYLENMPLKLQQFAVAAYQVAYGYGECMAFGWLLWDVIDYIRAKNKAKNGLENDISQKFQQINLSSQKLFQTEEDRQFYRALVDLKSHVGLEMPDELLERLFFQFKSSHFHQTGSVSAYNPKNDNIQNAVAKFIKFLAFSTENQDFSKACRNLLLQLAFQTNPQIFQNAYETQHTYRLQRFTVKMSVPLTPTMIQNLAKESECQLTFRKVVEEDAINYIYMHSVYVLLGYGTTPNMRRLREFLTVQHQLSAFIHPLQNWHKYVVRKLNRRMLMLNPKFKPSSVKRRINERNQVIGLNFTGLRME